MQIILLEKVINVGNLGDVVKVKHGYARNYLIPQGKAKRATAENIKITLGSAYPLEEELTMRIRGRDILTGLPKEISIASPEVRKALHHSVRAIITAIKSTIEETPPELVADLMVRGIDRKSVV